MTATKFQDLSKDQKQKIFLGVLVGVVMLGALKMFAYDAMMAKWDAAQKTITDLESKVRIAQQAQDRSAGVLKRLKEVTGEMVALNNEGMPLPGNEYAWAARQVFNAAGKLGKREMEVKESGRTAPDGRFVSKLNKGPYFQAYTATVNQRSGYGDLADLLKQIEQGNPYVTVSRLSIHNGDNPELHEVTFHLQWPVIDKPEEFKKLQELAK